eukprot:TRINITY_DN7151_c0_g2_i10.p1 TRINITY_DN7151_c0_g2~~TRINITY_DN7151_c0_g2_i10.p1  ORF type:complete len:488 (-),score=77.63 TRINITY_DN7151_c0_g2_i10:639-2102(-)
MMEAEYQGKHLKFISNNNGSTVQEIVIAGLPVHLSSLLVGAASLVFNHTSYFFRFFELIVVVVSPLLSLTILSDYGEIVISCLSSLVILLFITIIIKKKGAVKDLKRLWDLKIAEENTLDCVTNYRSSMLLITAICILAVDFPIFPRKFAKTENFGQSVMDLGVGGFVFAAGLVSREGRGKFTKVRQTISRNMPLVGLGFVRLAMVTMSGYHSNITEYGMHWNFFFTLFFVKVFGSVLIPRISDGRRLWIASVMLAVMYEGVLSFGVVDYILSDGPRYGIIDENREGVSSLQGYLAIYLAGAAWANQIYHSPFTFTVLGNVVHDLAVWSILMWLNLFYSTTFFMPPSRRLANYTFFSLTVAYNLSILSGFLLIEAIVIFLAEIKTGDSRFTKEKKNRIPTKRKKDVQEMPKLLPWKQKGVRTSVLYQAISYNPLTFFILANLATGLVNVMFRTVEIDGCPAVLILTGYLATLSTISLILYSRSIKIA